MSEQTVVAESSSAQTETTPSFDIPRSGTPEYTKWRTDGTLPEKSQPKPAAPATADATKVSNSEPEKAEPAGESEPPVGTQEHSKGNRAEARIKQLLSETKRLQSELEEVRKAKPTEAESSPAKPEQPRQPQTYQEWRKAAFKATEWVQQYQAEHPEESYEEANAAMADFLADVRDGFRSREQAFAEQKRKWDAQVNEATTRYENFDEIRDHFASKVVNDPEIPFALKEVLNDSDVLPHLIYALAENPEAFAEFVAMAKKQPTKAVRKIAVTEELIRKELAKGTEVEPEPSGTRNEKGQFTAKAEKQPEPPAKRGPESAPEPPIEISNRGAGPMDEAARALQAIERGDANAFRSWKQAEDAKELRRRRGE